MITSSKILRDAFWNEDEKKGSVIRRQYDEIKRVIESYDMEWVKERYREIKRHAIEQTEFYNKYRVDDEFPVVNKTILTENYEKVRARGGFLTPTHISSTSGSTGTPFSVIQDYEKRKRTIADLQVFGELCDYPIRERMIFFRVLSENLHRTKEQEERENIFYIDSSNLDEFHLAKMHDAILKKRPRIIFSYASTLVKLAKYILSLNKTFEYKNLKSVLTAGEALSKEDRELLKSVFGCKVYRRYSDMELGILAQDNGDGGEYFLNFGSYFFECLKLDSDNPAEYGEVGRIVVTDLFNKAFPMIRYDTGDLGIMIQNNNGDFPVLKEIYGRVRDCIYDTCGNLISPAKISVSMWGIDNIKQWQFIQETEKGYVLKLNCETFIDTDFLIFKFKDILGADADMKIMFVNEIPTLSSNKRRAVICNYKK